MTLCTHGEAAENAFITCSIAKDPEPVVPKIAVITNTFGRNPVYPREQAGTNETTRRG